jgi:hypothetical protein
MPTTSQAQTAKTPEIVIFKVEVYTPSRGAIRNAITFKRLSGRLSNIKAMILLAVPGIIT